MLTLFTGVPGSGKSAAGVDLLLTLTKDGTRPLYVLEVLEENVPPLDLKIPHTLIRDDDCKRWHELVPDGAIVFAPEAQRIWPARAPSARVPEHAEAIGQHRHRAIDMVVDTQGPKLLDDKVRLRVGRHVHIRDLGILGRHWYEWPECADPNQWRGAPVKTRYRLPRRVFKLYTSATQHIKPVRKFPPVLLALLLLVPLLAFLAFRIYSGIADKNTPKPAASAVMPTAPGSVYAGARAAALPPVTAADMVMASTPRLGDDPRSAPQFDEVRRVVRMPRIMGGWCRGGVCRCYIDDAMKAPISAEACARWVADPPFDAYHQPSQALPQDRMQGGSREAGANAMAPGSGGAAPGEPRSGVAALPGRS